MSAKTIATADAPAAIGPYSQGIEAAGTSTIYVSGQIPLDPATGNLVDGDIAAQTKRCFENIAAILEAANATLADVVDVTVLLTDIADFAAMNEAYAQFFEEPYPARAAFQVAALPKGAQIEIKVVANV